MHNRIILLLSLPLAALLIMVSCIGLFTPGFYAAETLNWQAQSAGQDLIDLFFITPCLLISAFFAFRNRRPAFLIWGGVVLYLSYTFVLYCFDVHFNSLFVLYCFCLGLAFYALMYFLFTQFRHSKLYFAKRSAAGVTGIYFIIIAILFYTLWLSEILPAIMQHRTPKSTLEAGLFTNGVHVLDLAIVLPGIFISGIFLLRSNSFGPVLAPLILTFFVLMDITIGLLVVVMKQAGVETDLSLTVVMAILALISLLLLIWCLRTLKPMTAS